MVVLDIPRRRIHDTHFAAKTSSGRTALHYASMYHDLATIELLLQQKP
ncbi:MULTISPECIES: hypothetical protein [Pirellulaceae]